MLSRKQLNVHLGGLDGDCLEWRLDNKVSMDLCEELLRCLSGIKDLDTEGKVFLIPDPEGSDKKYSVCLSLENILYFLLEYPGRRWTLSVSRYC